MNHIGDTTVSDLIPESYWDSVSRVYLKDDDGQNELDKELPQLRRFLPKMALQLKNLYRFVEAVDKGGGGLVSRVVDVNLTKLQDRGQDFYRALKLARPVEGRESLLNTLIAKEFHTLASLTHTNVMKLYYADSMSDDTATRSFYVMDFIEGKMTARDYVKAPDVSFSDFVRVLKDIMTGMAFLFSKNIVHNDIKPSNVLLQNGRAIISDLGSATRLDVDDATMITFTLDYAHPNKLEQAIKTRDGNRMHRTLPSRGFEIAWDLYSLGLSILELLNSFADSHRDGITPYQYRYLRLLGSRLLDGYVAGKEQAYAFPHMFYEETKYIDIQDPLLDLAKLTGEYRIETSVPELDFFSGENIQIAMHGQTPMSDNVKDIVAHPAFKRLSSVSQLGLISYVYPSATHTRGEHSLGAFGNAARMIYALWNDPVNPMFRQIMRPEDLTACLLATLLHDIGQYPLAHDLEEADPMFKHEEIGYSFFDEEIETEESLNSRIDRLWKNEPGRPRMSAQISKILHADAESVRDPIRARILHGIVDGPIDADKLDYLVRDSVKLKVPYGLMIDFERLSKMLTVVHSVDGKDLSATIGVHEKGKVSAESVAFARYALFGSVYWHHTSRAIKAMLHHAAWDTLARIQAKGRSVFQSGFADLILKNRLPSVQQELFRKQDTEAMKQALWPGINLADLQVLAWLWDTSGAAGKSLVEDLCGRKLYKRVLEISQPKHKNIWSKAVEFSGKASAVDRLALDYALQSEVITYLSKLKPDDKKKQTRVLDDTAMDRVYRLISADVPIVLVDIPPDRTGGMHDLKFFRESWRWRYYEDDLVKIEVEDSQVWADIIKNFSMSLGKVRIFVHENIKDTVRAIDPKELTSMLQTALNSYPQFRKNVLDSRQ